jgi:hypothetical protein
MLTNISQMANSLNFNKSGFRAVTICASLMLSACGGSGVGESYRSASDWMNNVPEIPEPDAWRLSKREDTANAPYPKLSDVPARPTGGPTREVLDQRVKALQQDADEAKIAPSTGDPTAAARFARAQQLGAPAPATIAPLSIPGVGKVGRQLPPRS